MNHHLIAPIKNTGAPPLLELKQAIIRPENGEIPQPINWTIHTGEHWAVVGPTGSGKSLIVDAILKKSPLAGGRILYYFDSSSAAKAHGCPFFNRNDIIHVSTSGTGLFQNHAYGFHQSRWHSMMEMEGPLVSDYLCPETVHRISAFEVITRAAERQPDFSEMAPVISLMSIEHLLARRVQHLSHGELRKVLIARALVQHPKLLILDDPFAGLDTRTRQKFRLVLEALLSSRDIHVLLITARPEEIPNGINHILHMADVRIIPQTRKNNPPASLNSLTGPGINVLPTINPGLYQSLPGDRAKKMFNAPVIVEIKRV